jgi:hypothetical protein
MRNDDTPTQVFGLTKAQLRPIVEEIAGEPVDSLEVRIEHEVQGPYGAGAEKLVPTFSYVTTGGGRGEAVVFAKRFYEELTGPREAHHYRYLAHQGAAIPRIYGALRDEQDREILLLEYVDVITEARERFVGDAEQFPSFLSVLAQFNAIQPSSEYAALLRRGMAMWQEPWEARVANAPALLHRIWERAEAGELGEALQRTCSSASGALAPLCRLAAQLLELVSHMEVGLVHNDLSLEHVGRRRQTGELLLFDLDDIGLTPRFYDVAGWLGAPDQIESRCAPREELAQHYLAAYARRGGIAPPLTAFLDEIRALWLVSEFSWLQWYLHEALEEPWERTRRGDEDYPRESREGVHRHLAILLAQVGDSGISSGSPG